MPLSGGAVCECKALTRLKKYVKTMQAFSNPRTGLKG